MPEWPRARDGRFVRRLARRRARLWVTMGLLLLALARRAEAAVVSLEQVEEQALTQRGTVAAESAQLEAARASAAVAKSADDPTLALKNDASIAPGSRLVRILDTDGNPFLVQGSQPIGDSGAFTPELRYGSVLSLESKVYDFGRTGAAVRAAEARAAAARAGLMDERARVLVDVRMAYVAWLSAVETSAAADRAAAVAREGVRRLEARVAEGLRRPADLAPARHNEVRARLDALEARGRMAAARLGLESAIGAPLPRDAEPDRSLLDRSFGAPAPFRRPTALRRQREAALAEARAHERAHAPVLSAGADAGVRGQRDQIFPIYRAAVFFSIPLWDGGAESARARVARATAAELAARQQEAERALLTEHLRAEAAWRVADERIALGSELLEAARQMVSDAESRYELGEATIEQVIEARSTLIKAEIDLLQAKVARAEAGLRLAPADR